MAMGSRRAEQIVIESDWHAYLHGKGRRHARRRSVLKKEYRETVRAVDFQELLLYAIYHLENDGFNPQGWFKNLNDTSSDALRFVLRHGKKYRGVYSPDPMPDPVPKHCSQNSYHLARSVRKRKLKHKNPSRKETQACFSYVEGLALGPYVCPMAHAWNAQSLKGSQALDWTFHALSYRTLYLGVALTLEEYEQICNSRAPSNRQRNFLLFHKDNFNLRIKLELRKVLAKRKREGKKLPTRLKSLGER